LKIINSKAGLLRVAKIYQHNLFKYKFSKNMKIRHLSMMLIIGLLFGFIPQKNTPPNIVWIVCEDMSPHLGSYGEKVAKTPNLDQLAADGVRYTNAFTTAGVCAPSRNAIITGRFQTANGGHNMRTLGMSANVKDAYPEGFKTYSTLLPDNVVGYPEYLRQAGYYCTNNAKEDYQFVGSPTMWDESSKKAHWRNRKDKSQPFFSIFNIEVTHESQVWARDKEPLLVNPKDVEVPPYYPDDSVSRKVIARFLSNVMVMDQKVGEIIEQLKEDNLYENTVIFFYSDHGDGLPYVKRELHHRGLRIPLIIKAPFLKAGTTDSQLISAIDFAPTLLSLANFPIPKTIHGKAFLGTQKSVSKNKYIYGARDRMDSELDRVRSVSDGRFNYLRYYMPEKPFYQNIRYRLQNPLMPHLLKLKEEGKLNASQMLWFRPSKPSEELFDTQNDPFELNNLANDPNFAPKLKELQAAHQKWLKDYKDWGAVNEMDMVKLWWKGMDTPPITAEPKINLVNGKINVSSATKGASIGYRKSTKDSWTVYQRPFDYRTGDSIYIFAHKIGLAKVEKTY
jgi:arylsulfatase A-like enzyme